MASLARPWLIIESATHNEGIWRNSADTLKAHFTIGNYGNAPAFVYFIHAGLFISPGPEMNEAFPFRPWPKTIKRFPQEHELTLFINEITANLSREYFTEDGPNGAIASYERIDIDEPFPVRAGAKTINFSILGLPPISHPEVDLAPEMSAKVFFAGRVGYAGPDEVVEVIHFFYYVKQDGSFGVFRGAPHNQRKRNPKS